MGKIGNKRSRIHYECSLFLVGIEQIIWSAIGIYSMTELTWT